MNGVDKRKDELADKLTDLELKMKQLQQSLMDERLRLNRDRGDADDLPDDWVSMNRLHLPQCPLAKTASVVHKPACPVHGNDGLVSRSLPHLPVKKETVDCDRYSKLIDEAEKFSRLDNVNEKFRELYDCSMFSPTFYRPRVRSQEETTLEKDLEKRLVRFAQACPSREESSPNLTSTNKSSESLDNASVTHISSGRSERCSSAVTPKEVQNSEDESSVDLFNPFDAIESVRNKFLDIENFINEASNKTRIKEVS